jgi:hypothetical protein
MRRFPAIVLTLTFALDAAAQGPEASARIVVQNSPLAGYQHYDGKALWHEMKPGDALTLVREPDNPHDASAIRLEWRGRKLGYVPRRENSDLARQMDRGMAAEARITALKTRRNGRNLISYEISVPLARQ